MKLSLHIRELVSILGVFGLYSVPFIPFYYYYPQFWKYYLGFAGVLLLGNLLHTIIAFNLKQNQTEPLDDEFIEGYLQNQVEEIAEEMGVRTPSVSVLPNKVINASAYGILHYTSQIQISSEAVSKLNKSQLRSVIAHEISHIKSRDTIVMYILQSPYIISRRITINSQKIASDPNVNVVISALLLLISALGEIFSKILLLLIRNVSRQREFLADYDASTVTTPQTVISTLKRIEECNSRFTEEDTETSLLSDFSSSLFATHPSTESRISKIQEGTTVDQTAKENAYE